MKMRMDVVRMYDVRMDDVRMDDVRMDDVRMDDVKMDDVRHCLKKTILHISCFFFMVLKNWKKIYPHIIFHLQFFEPFPISCYFFVLSYKLEEDLST